MKTKKTALKFLKDYCYAIYLGVFGFYVTGIQVYWFLGLQAMDLIYIQDGEKKGWDFYYQTLKR